MSVTYRKIISSDFTNALKKVGEFYSESGKSNERLLFARFKEKVDKEIEIYNSISKDITDKYLKDFRSAKTELEKQLINNDVTLRQSELADEKSRLKVRLPYEFVEKAKIDGNDLFSLFPILIGVCDVKLEEVQEDDTQSS